MADAVRFPPDESELSGRLQIALGDEPQAAFARRAEVAESVLRKYLAGAMPSADRLVRLADAAGVRIAWLAAGRGPKKGSEEHPPATPASPAGTLRLDDMKRLQEAVLGVVEGLDRIGRKLPPEKFAELVGIAYEMIGDWQEEERSARVVRFIKAVA